MGSVSDEVFDPRFCGGKHLLEKHSGKGTMNKDAMSAILRDHFSLSRGLARGTKSIRSMKSLRSNKSGSEIEPQSGNFYGWEEVEIDYDNMHGGGFETTSSWVSEIYVNGKEGKVARHWMTGSRILARKNKLLKGEKLADI